MSVEGSDDFKDLDSLLNKSEHDETKGATSQSEALKAIVDFEEENSDLNTESYKSTIRTTAVPTDKETNVEELLEPQKEEGDLLLEQTSDSKGSKKDNISQEYDSGKLVEKEALKAASKKDEITEDLEVYEGEEDTESSNQESWTLIRCTSEENSEIIEDLMEEDKKRVSVDEEVVENMDTDDSFEILETEEMETDVIKGEEETKVKVEREDADTVEDNSSEKEGGMNNDPLQSSSSDDLKKDAEDSEMEMTTEDETKVDESRKDEDSFEDPLEANKAKSEVEEKKGEADSENKTKKVEEKEERNEAETKEEKNLDGEKEEEKDTVSKDMTEEDGKDTAETTSPKDEPPTDDADSAAVKEKPAETFTDKVQPGNRWSAPEFDEIKVSEMLDFGPQKTKARLRKKGALAKTRKPDRSTWFVESTRSTDWMFTDSTEPKPFKEDNDEEEEEQPTPRSKKTSPLVSSRRPPGAMASPLLLAGLGQKPMLRKTPAVNARKKSPPTPAGRPFKFPSPDTSKPTPATRSPKVGIKVPPGAIKSPFRLPPGGVKLFPTPKSESPTTTQDSKKVAAKPLLSHSLKPVTTNTSNEPHKSDTVPLKSPTVHAKKPPPVAKPSPKPRPKPQPKPRPSSIAVSGIGAGSQLSIANELKEQKKQDVNSDILRRVSSPPAENGLLGSPTWMSESRNKILPPIQPSPTQNAEAIDPMEGHRVPKWKQDLLKKKKEAEASGVKKPVVPPPIAKKPSPSGAPFTTLPQWQQDLADRKRRKKEGDNTTPHEEDSNKKNEVSEENSPRSPKDPVPIPSKEIPPWRKALREKKKMNEKNAIKDEGEKKDIEKVEQIITSPKKSGHPPLSGKGTVPQWQLELASRKSKLAKLLSQREEDND